METDLAEVFSEERVQALHRTGLLDEPPEEAFDRLTRLASSIIGAPTALVSLVDRDRQFFKSTVGFGPQRETPLSHSFCKHVVATGVPLVVEDAREHPLVKDNPAITDLDVVSYCGVPLRDDAGNVLGSFCVIDSEAHHWSPEKIELLAELAEMVMTEIRLRQVANDLETANGALSEMNQSLRDFVAVASHDMKNPLTAVLGFSSAMTRGWDTLAEESKRNYVGIIERQARFLSRLVEDLLTISRIEAGAVLPAIEVLDLGEVVEHIIQVMPDEAEAIEVQAEPGLKVRADADHLRRIVTNLVSNAFKYGAAPVSVVARSKDGNIVIEVSDEGDGVPGEFVPRLFAKFSRAPSDDAQAQEGTGLGLSIVQGLTRANGGTIRYEPNEPRGSRFVVELPEA